MKENLKGFTLVELVLVISVVVVLSVISGPIYRSYAYKARQAEGYALLGTIRSAQESYYGEYGAFLHWSYSDHASNGFTSNDTILGIDARPNKYYTAFCIGRRATDSGTIDEMKYFFRADTIGHGAANLTMIYNRTSGVTMLSSGLNANDSGYN